MADMFIFCSVISGVCLMGLPESFALFAYKIFPLSKQALVNISEKVRHERILIDIRIK